MFLQLWLSCATTCYYGSGLVNYIGKTHALSSSTENEGTRNPTWVLEDKLAMVYGRTLWKDFVPFSICQYSILVSTYPAATGGNNMRVCHVGKVYNFCRRSNSKYLAVSPVMDNTEQIRPEAMGNLDIPISKSKT